MRLWTWVRRALGLSTFDSAPRPIDRIIAEFAGYGGRVSRKQALTVPGVLKGRNLVCSVSTLPLIETDAQNRPVRNPLLEQIDPDVPNVITMAQTLEDLLLEGVAWWRVTARLADDFPASARRLDPSTVSLDPPEGGFGTAPLPAGDDPRGVPGVYVDGKFVPARDIRRFDSPNPPVLVAGARVIRKVLEFDEAAAMYAASPGPLDYFSPAPGADPISDDRARENISAWRAARRKGGTGWVPASMVYNPVSAATAADMQLAELNQRAAIEVANIIGVDPEVLGVSTTSRTYANAQDWRRDRINDVYAAYMKAITDRLSMGDTTRRGYKVTYNLDEYMRANPTERWGVYEKGINMGVLGPEEVRRAEGLPPGAPARPASTPAPAAPGDAGAGGDELAARRAARFDGPTLTTFAATTVRFSVDATTRRVRGLAVPWGETASKFGIKYRFEKSSLTWSDVARVKMLRDHDFGQPLGRGETIRDASDGLEVEFAIARGDDGDRALALAEDGVLDGLSVGIEFDMDPDAGDITTEDDGTIVVRSAVLREVSLTAMPAFDSARVTSVAASRDGEAAVPPVPPEVAPAAAGPTTLTLSDDQRTALLGLLQPPAPAPAAGPTVVNPAAPGPVATSVAEAAPYRFDRRGNLRPGTHDFSSDLFAAFHGDRAAMDRAEGFIRDRFRSLEFDVDRADVAGLNPSQTRPDMWVPQRTFTYPVWNSVVKGTLADSTPFILPKFSSASGLVAAHTEGVEPTPGTFVGTTQTITPTAVSGKIELTREAWDQGGNPQASGLIWAQMEKAWYEALEARIIATLDAATPTAIALTAGGGTTGQTLSAELEAAIATLQFARGGLTMTDTATQIDLYKALAAAKDDAKRPLYPMIGPANANGQASTRFGAIDVGGILFHPAWALAATGSAVASSYLYDRESVHGWATAPNRLQFEYRVAYIDIAIWGYGASAITDIAGVREITYDPVA